MFPHCKRVEEPTETVLQNFFFLSEMVSCSKNMNLIVYLPDFLFAENAQEVELVHMKSTVNINSKCFHASVYSVR